MNFREKLFPKGSLLERILLFPFKVSRKNLSIIRSSNLFDAQWYLAAYPDLAQLKSDPALHYLQQGALEGRNPGPHFNSKFYLDSYPDVKNSGMNPLLHYLRYGQREGRIYNPIDLVRNSGLFDMEWYRAKNPDIVEAKIDPLYHYLGWGGLEGRTPGPHFCSSWYLHVHPELLAAGTNPLVHYLISGNRNQDQVGQFDSLGNLHAEISDEFVLLVMGRVLPKLYIFEQPVDVLSDMRSYLSDENYFRTIKNLLKLDQFTKPVDLTNPPITQVIQAARLPKVEKNPRRRNILFVLRSFPSRFHNGGNVVRYLLKMLSEQNDIYVVAGFQKNEAEDDVDTIAHYCRGMYRIPYDEFGNNQAEIRRWLGDTEIDIVHYEWPGSLTNYDPGFGKKQLFRYMEAVSLRYLMELSGIAAHTEMWANKFLEILHFLPVELMDTAVLDARIAVTNKDAEFFHNLYPLKPIYVINPGISLDDYSLPEVMPEPHSMIFTGYFTHSPNIDAMHFFFEEVWPGVCRQVPDARIYIVGDAPSEYLTNLADGKQIIVTGRVQDIRPYIQKASIGIAPLISGAGVRIKVMEYAALRRTCVATSIAVTDLMLEDGKDFLLADTAADFIRNIVSLLTDEDLNRRMANSAYEAVRKNHDFRSSVEYHLRLYDLLEQPAVQPPVAVAQQAEDRAGQVDRWLDFYEKRAEMLGRPGGTPGAPTRPLVSILILTFNNIQVSKLCLTSLYCNTSYPNFEVIVVDNASSDETPAWLGKFAEAHSNFKYIINTENRGFAAGNNQAAALAAGDYLVFLNNDTVVTDGWIERLLQPLEADNTIGIVGPVTNAIGNEARIATNYRTPIEMEALSAWRARYLAGRTFEIGVLAFYCVMARRNEFLAFGGLDERYGLGLFEDVDMADQVRQAGQRVVCVEDVFIHHFHRASFGKIDGSVYDDLFETNQRLFEEKWAKKWEPFKYPFTGSL